MGIDDRIKSAYVVSRGLLLDERCEVLCSCGYKKDCGYMRITADRLAEWHDEKCNGTVIVVSSPCEPLTRAQIVRNVRLRGGPSSLILDSGKYL